MFIEVKQFWVIKIKTCDLSNNMQHIEKPVGYSLNIRIYYCE